MALTCVTDSSARRSLLSNAQSLVRITKGRDIILSSAVRASVHVSLLLRQ